MTEWKREGVLAALTEALGDDPPGELAPFWREAHGAKLQARLKVGGETYSILVNGPRFHVLREGTDKVYSCNPEAIVLALALKAGIDKS